MQIYSKLLAIVFSERAIFFVSIWLLLGALINVNDQRAYTLQHAGVDAIVSHGTYQLGFSEVDRLKNVGDTFHYEGKILAAKQPGQFTFGAMAYFPLKALGYDYTESYEKTASLVTFFSSVFLVALASLGIQLLVREVWGLSRKAAYLSALSYAFGSIVCAYSGLPHHDTIAGALLLLSFYFFERHKQEHSVYSDKRTQYALLSGFMAGLVIFTSMLAALVTLSLGIYVLAHRNIKTLLTFGIGFALGLAPLAAYNFHYFGNPLIQANVAGNFTDTFFTLKYSIFSDHVRTYLGNGFLPIWKYMPIICIGFLGALGMIRRFRPQASFILLATAIHLSYILNIETIGHCQFGPRYFLPLVPFFALGVSFWFRDFFTSHTLNQTLHYSIGLILIFSIVVNVIGGVGGTMYCALDHYAPLKHYLSFSYRTIADLPLLFGSLNILLLYWLMSVVYNARNLAKSHNSSARLPVISTLRDRHGNQH